MQKKPLYEKIEHPIMLPKPGDILGSVYCQPDSDIHFLHVHDLMEIGYCHQGQGIFIIENEVLRYTQGDVIIIPPRLPHLAQSTLGTTSEWTFSYLDIEEVLALGPVLPDTVLVSTRRWHFLHRPTHEPLSQITRLLSDAVVGKSDNRTLILQGLVLTLFSMLASKQYLEGTPITPPNNLGPIAPAINYLSTHFTQPFSTEHMADICHLSPGHFRRLFKQKMGVSPRNYIFKLRIEMAKGLLSLNQMPVTRIAESVGFTSLSSFNRQFSAIAGANPRGWRNEQGS